VRILRDVHRDVGAADQRLHVGAVLRSERHPDAGVDVEEDVGDSDGIGKRRADSLRNRECVLRPVEVVGEDGELVPAEPGDRVALSHG
jgi:hypothetical protein